MYGASFIFLYYDQKTHNYIITVRIYHTLNPGLQWQKLHLTRRTLFYQKIGLEFEEETSKMLHLERGFVWCWNWDWLCEVLKLGLALWGAETGTGFVRCWKWDWLCMVLKLGLAFYGAETGNGFMWCWNWDWLCVVLKLGRCVQQIRNTWKVLKCGAGKGWGRSVGPIVRETKKWYMEWRSRGISYME
jgi:hypothetical protein